MRRDLRILLVTAALGAIAVWGERVPEALVRMETFHVEHVEVRGARYLDEQEVVALLALRPETSVWSDKAIWRERVMAHPLVKDARITRQVPDGLRVDIEERTPIALAPTPTLEPVDALGYRLPLDPSEFRLDLPVIQSKSVPPKGSRLFPEDVRRLAREVEHLMAADTAFLQLVSSVESGEAGGIVARWSEPAVDFLLPSQAPPARLREALGALSDAVARSPDVPREIDLRFADQVVVRREGR